MRRFFNSQVWLVVVSIIFAILLFLTAMSSNYNRTGSQVSGATETYTHTLTNVPIDIKYDSDKYTLPSICLTANNIVLDLYAIDGYRVDYKVILMESEKAKLLW